jgi:hypothetical protein
LSFARCVELECLENLVSVPLIQSFEAELTKVIGKPTDLRPFVCDGSPLECDVFIVGLNPATKMSEDFWHFWRAGHGFDKKVWFEAYKKDRQLRPLKPGKARRNAISNSRRVIDWIIDDASPAKCLETNIYSAPTEQAVDLVSEQRITRPFDYLLTKIRPRVIVVHGEDATRHVEGKSLSGVRIIRVSHFSRGWSQESARALGQQIKEQSAAR